MKNDSDVMNAVSDAAGTAIGNGAAGFRKFEVTDAGTNATFPVLVMYPSATPEKLERMGPYELSLAQGGEIAQGTFGLVVLSHGTGGSPFGYLSLAAALARHGFVVALPEHPGNNTNNNALANELENFENRPTHVRRVADWAFDESPFRAVLEPGRVAIVGHSLGGYTALATAGGHPLIPPERTPEGMSRVIKVSADERVKALVLLAPAVHWYLDDGTLRDVHVPILIFSGEQDEWTPPFHGEAVERGVPDPSLVEHRIVPNAGHFAFLTPFPESMRNPAFPPSWDPPGFDREAFQHELQAEVASFLKRSLAV